MDNINIATQQQAVRIPVASQEGQSTHSYSSEEVHAFSQHINNSLKDDPHLQSLLPIDSESKQLFDAVGNGIILCKLINKACPGTIFTKAINIEKLNIFKIKENLNLAITSAREIGCVIINVHSGNIIDKTEHIILGLLWQIIKVHLLGGLDLKLHPYLIRLKKEDEEAAELLRLSKEELLTRWFNYHLSNAKREKFRILQQIQKMEKLMFIS
ncbi:hypothetical protein IMG5_098970 [Ichthyophthirius multifiliis]|uniref:Calponin-homology (CH) domain-containing protein n=1 Tax=Ichthyophthirius multifiliis TaxID=5932 RepID=G0QS31_ICHMU|nr:hypothetical protein IMG5_098970 [Ichthyophthirius multifiliis]EGR31973.1 hypothetical protein IMG5_098970 [Ichthyophthirius multifiliis]|eukprot:XP_004035459.1 hypothetical protein IMG5_098970 [Ichthyophthirius multifiliis]